MRSAHRLSPQAAIPSSPQDAPPPDCAALPSDQNAAAVRHRHFFVRTTPSVFRCSSVPVHDRHETEKQSGLLLRRPLNKSIPPRAQQFLPESPFLFPFLFPAACNVSSAGTNSDSPSGSPPESPIAPHLPPHSNLASTTAIPHAARILPRKFPRLRALESPISALPDEIARSHTLRRDRATPQRAIVNPRREPPTLPVARPRSEN